MHNNESVSLYDRFELLNLDRDDGVKTFEAREISTGRPVKVHLFVHAGAPLQVALLKAIERLPGEERQRVLDRGKHEGTPYVVTDRLVDYPGLSEWVQAASRPVKPDPTGAEAGRAEPTRPEPDAAKPTKAVLETAGAWKLPQTPPAAKGSPASLNQQFAELFPTAERPVLMPETVILPPARPAAKPVPASGPPPAAQLSAPPPPPSAPPPPPPGEFTRMFQSPVANQAQPPPSSAPAPASNDFERFFEPTAPAGPMPRSPVVQQPLTPQAPGNAGPNKVGEFTRMFGKGDLGAFAAPPAAPPPPKEPGEFTRMFQSPVAPPAPAAPPPASPSSGAPSFGTPSVGTPSFAAPSFSAPPPAAPPYSPPPAANPPMAKPAGPGEYTRQFSAPAPMTFGQPVVQPAGTPPAAPPAAAGIQQPSAFAAPAAPAMTAPAPPLPQKNNLPLILGIAAIVIVAIVIVVIFALRPK